MSFDTTAAAVALRGVGALTGSPGEAVTMLYRDRLNDLWNWHDLHVGPSGLACGGAQLSGGVLVGTPFVNAHYARQLQVWAVQVRPPVFSPRHLSRLLTCLTGGSVFVQVAAVGQHWDAHARLLSLVPPSLAFGDRLPWFVPGAAGTLELADSNDLPATGISDIRVLVTVLSGHLNASEIRVTLNASFLAPRAQDSDRNDGGASFGVKHAGANGDCGSSVQGSIFGIDEKTGGRQIVPLAVRHCPGL